MCAETLSISLSPEAVAVIDAYRAAHALKSRSQVIERALQRLREEPLETACRAAAGEVDAQWDATSGDGLADETEVLLAPADSGAL